MERKGKGKGNQTSKAVIAAARVHIDNIRKTKFSIGSNVQNPLTQDLHNAVTRLSSELYAKDIHFLMELIQNAEDNKYLSTVKPALEFVLTKEDVTDTGAPATLLAFNNEVGFSRADIDSICSIGQSTKKAKRSQGFIGEKGIGFKSVFLVSAQPYIFSNGYQIRFCEVPNGDCGIGYIVPEWINERPSLGDLGCIYSDKGALPTTIIILPLKPEKVEAVKKELMQIHPEVLLFLQKIRRLTVRDESSALSSKGGGSLSSVSILNETTLIPSNNQVVDSRVVQLSAKQESNQKSVDTCRYYLHKQVFPIKTSIIVEERKEVKELMICLAFPFDKRLKRGGSDAGIFAFLPTGMITNFPFIIHSDFVLASSREAILMDNRWNLGSLELVPLAYVRALMTCLNSVETIGLGSKSRVLDFLPIKESPFPILNSARDAIKGMLQKESIVPCQSFSDAQIVLYEPTDALLICQKFRSILAKAKQQKITLGAVSSHMKHAIHDSVDHEKYGETWKFLGVESASCNYDWYLKFIKTSNIISRSSEDLYTDVICFLANNWTRFHQKSVDSIPFIKYVTWSGDTMLCSVLQIRQETLKVRIVWEANEHAWLSKWNCEMGCLNDVFFCPDYLVHAFVKVKNQQDLKKWLISTVGVVVTDIFKYCMELISFIRENKDPGIVLQLTYFVYFSAMKNHIKHHDLSRLLLFLPVVEKSKKVSLCSRSLVPAATGSWTKLFGSINRLSVDSDSSIRIQHDLMHQNDMDDIKQNCGYYAELGDVYSAATIFNGETIAENELLNFLVKNEKAFDLPKAPPPNIPLKLASNKLTCDQALLLLEWIKNMRLTNRLSLPARFSDSINSTKWLKTYSDFRSPKHCYLQGVAVENKAILELGEKLKVFSAIDEVYYAFKIKSYMNELEFLGVQVKTKTMSELIIPHVKQMASFKIEDPELVIILMDVIKYLRESNKLYGDLKKNLKEGKWLKMTVNGCYACPEGSIFLTSLEKAIGQITSLHVVDSLYYGYKLSPYLDEFKFLGVVVDTEEVYKLISKTFKFPEDLSSLNLDSVFLLLECIRSVGLVAFCTNHDIHCKAWMKTVCGFACPAESMLLDSNLTDLANVVSYTFIDESYYGIKIRSYKAELKAIGVIIGLDSAAGELVVSRLNSVISSVGLSALNVISLLRLFKSAKISTPSFVSTVVDYLSREKWVKTKHDYQYAMNTILFDSEWASISQLIDLPFVDEIFYGVEISSFIEELKILGVVVNLREGGIHFIVHGLKNLQEDLSFVTADAAFTILQCVESLLNSNVVNDKILLEELIQKLSVSKWVKTRMGYRLPGEALLFNQEWECLLKEVDGPFIDREFYKKIASAQDNGLRAIGVKTDLENVCGLIFKNLTSHDEIETETNQVLRIYRFLYKFRWTPKSDDDHSAHKLWIPDKSDNSKRKRVGGGRFVRTDVQKIRGKWVNNVDCVIHDENNLFEHCLNSLDKHYHQDLLPFLKSAFDVPEIPTLDHYLALWKSWCETSENASVEKLKFFWGFFSRNWFGNVSENIRSSFTKLPAVGGDTGTQATQHSMNIQLMMKEQVYIGDDLLLKKAFSESNDIALFSWFPEDNSISYIQLNEIYTSLGVKKISESVEYSVNGIFRNIEKEVDLIGKPLLKLVIAFLASPLISVPTHERHSMVKSLGNIPVFSTDEDHLLQVKYRLHLPLSNKLLHIDINKKVFFDSKVPRFLVHRQSWCKEKKDIQLINDFARAISDAVSLKSGSLDLTKLIKMGFSFLQSDQEVDDLLTSENLEVSVMDQEFVDELLLLSPMAVIPSLPHTPEIKSFKRLRD